MTWEYLGGIAFTRLYVRDYRDENGILCRVETRRDNAGFAIGKPKTRYQVDGIKQKFRSYADALAAKE